MGTARQMYESGLAGSGCLGLDRVIEESVILTPWVLQWLIEVMLSIGRSVHIFLHGCPQCGLWGSGLNGLIVV